MKRRIPKIRPPFSLSLENIVRIIFILMITAMIVRYSIFFFKQLDQTRAMRRLIPATFMGIKFSGLDDILKGTTHIGYVTDKDLDVQKDAQQFTQAQYTLAPIILDLNNTHRQFLLFDCSSEDIAMGKIRELGAIPLRKNQFGIILATNPHFKNGIIPETKQEN